MPNASKVTNPATTVLGFKAGTKKHKAACMYLRTQGATNQQVVAALGGPHLNLLTQVAAAGHTVSRNRIRVNGKLVTSYRITLKGAAGKGNKAQRKANKQPKGNPAKAKLPAGSVAKAPTATS